MRRLVRYMFKEVIPASDELPGVADTDMREFVNSLKREGTPLMWYGLVGASAFVAATPVLTIGVPLPMFVLPRRLREKHLQKGVTHPLYLYRQAVFLLKMQAGLCWGRDDKVRTGLGLDPYPADPGTFRRD